MKIKNKITTVFTALILAFVCVLSGCGQDTSNAKEPSSEVGKVVQKRCHIFLLLAARKNNKIQLSSIKNSLKAVFCYFL